MDGILEKLDSYNILTNLLPGAFFVVGLRYVLGIEFPVKGIAEEIVLYYFAGLVISRLGSFITEPFLKRIGFVKFAPPSDFIEASGLDSKIQDLSGMNNHFRSLLTATVCIPVVWGVRLLTGICPFWGAHRNGLLVLGLGILFLFSYRKQTAYVREHVEKALEFKN
ncbi:MAG: hypothetical protein Q4C76_02595 [Bacillota bacterium]|nr:hypothetical protein [Bacillota bacterium]